MHLEYFFKHEIVLEKCVLLKQQIIEGNSRRIDPESIPF